MIATVTLRVIAYAVVPLVMALLGNHLAATTITSPNRRRMYRIGFFSLALVGIVMTAVVEVSSERSRRGEMQALQNSLNSVQTTLQSTRVASAADMGYLRGKLDTIAKFVSNPPPDTDIRHLADAVSKMAALQPAQPSQANQMPSNRVAISSLSVDGLRVLVQSVVRRIRESSDLWDSARRSARHSYARREDNPRLSSEDRKRLLDQEKDEESRLRVKYESQLKDALSDANSLREEMLKRLGPGSQTSQDKDESAFFAAALQGNFNESSALAAASYLEQLAKRLSQ